MLKASVSGPGSGRRPRQRPATRPGDSPGRPLPRRDAGGRASERSRREHMTKLPDPRRCPADSGLPGKPSRLVGLLGQARRGLAGRRRRPLLRAARGKRGRQTGDRLHGHALSSGTYGMITVHKQLLSGTPDDVRATVEYLARDQDDLEYLAGTWLRELAVKLAALRRPYRVGGQLRRHGGVRTRSDPGKRASPRSDRDRPQPDR